MPYKSHHRPTPEDPVFHHYKYGGREFEDTFSGWSFLSIPNLVLALLCQVVAAGLLVAKSVAEQEFLWLAFPALISTALIPWVYCLVRHFRTVTCNFNGSMLLAHFCAAVAWAMPLSLLMADGVFRGLMGLVIVSILWVTFLWIATWGMLRTISMANPGQGDLHREGEFQIFDTIEKLF